MDKTNERFNIAVEFLLSENKIASKKDLANMLEISQTGLSEIISGRNKLTSLLAANFCKLFNINLYWLFYGEGSIIRKDTDYDNNEVLELRNKLEKIKKLVSNETAI